jgi:hypothetical protein
VAEPEEVKLLPLEILVDLGAEVLLLGLAAQVDLGLLDRATTEDPGLGLQIMAAVAAVAQALWGPTEQRQRAGMEALVQRHPLLAQVLLMLVVVAAVSIIPAQTAGPEAAVVAGLGPLVTFKPESEQQTPEAVPVVQVDSRHQAQMAALVLLLLLIHLVLRRYHQLAGD